MSMFLFTACPSSGDDETESGTGQSINDSKPLSVAEELKPFIGFWTVEGTKYPYYQMFMFQDKKCWVRKSSYDSSSFSGSFNLYDWNYNGNTTLLSITNNFQCLISLIDTETWMGLTVGDKQSVSYTAKRKGDDYNYTEMQNDLVFIMYGTWQNVSNSEETFSCSLGDSPHLSYEGKSFFAPSSPYSIADNVKVEIEYDKASDKMTLKSSGRIKRRDIFYVTTYNIEIIHPYDYEHVYLIMDATLNTDEYRSNLKGTFKRKIQ